MYRSSYQPSVVLPLCCSAQIRYLTADVKKNGAVHNNAVEARQLTEIKVFISRSFSSLPESSWQKLPGNDAMRQFFLCRCRICCNRSRMMTEISLWQP
ncbi:hypothetical protein SPHINGOR109_10232 [Sphingorhabdus sp. 109]|nr:hypothetical protein SPHINGOR109_10232 [Sphingorhabdus sp. 109]